MIEHESRISLIPSRQLIHLSLLLWLQYIRMMLTSVSNLKNAFTFLAPSCPVIAKAAKKGRVCFKANVSGTGGKSHQVGLGGDHEKLGKGATGVALCYQKFEEYRSLSKEQQKELTEWNKANGGGKNQGKKKGNILCQLVVPTTNQTMPRSSRADFFKWKLDRMSCLRQW